MIVPKATVRVLRASRASGVLRRIALCFFVAITACAIHATSVLAQDSTNVHRRARVNWTLWDALGYGAIGALASYAVAWEADEGGEAILLGGTVGSIVLGAALGSSVKRRINSGRPVGGGRATAALLGVAGAGATVGALASVPLINGESGSAPGVEEGTPLGSDETTFALLAGTGAALGVWYALRHADELRSPRVTVGRRPTDDGGHAYALGMRLSF